MSLVATFHAFSHDVRMALMSELFKWVCAHFRAIPSLREHVSRAIMAELCKAAMKGCAICLLFEAGDTLFF
jgi:hypothetical protein